MSTRRGGGRGKHPNHRQSDERWILRPSGNPIRLPQHEEPSSSPHLPDQNYEQPSTSREGPVSEYVPNDQKHPRSRRNSRWISRNRRPHVSETRVLEEFEVGSSDSFDKGDVGGDEVQVPASSLCGEDGNLQKEEEKEPEKGTNKVPDLNKEVDEVENRLKEVRLSADEPKLSEDLLRLNDQAQEDELLALESIYGDNIFILDKQDGLRCLQIHIHIEAPKEFSIKANFKSATASEAFDLPDFLYSFNIEYLPQIILTCLLPKSYPSHLAPHFTISVQWLNAAKISELCSMLDSIWNSQLGQEVLYQWVDWLHSSSLSYLGFEQGLLLVPNDSAQHVDRRAISGSIGPDFDIPFLKRYDDEQRHENFLKNFHECSICFSEYIGNEFVRLPCEHFFCWNCIKTYSDMHVKEGTITKLHCPEAKCQGMVPPGLLKRLLGEAEFERWETLMLQKTLESMTDVAYCPRCETVCIEDEDQHAQCSKCFFSFCTLCRDRRHVGVACMTPEMRLLILQERQNMSQLKDEQRRREQDMINELLSVKEINRSAKQCPSCKMAISRTEGCNKMVCQNCGKYFCYRCNQAIDGYEHFREGNCELFPAEAIQMWEERMNARQVVGQIQAEMLPDRGHSCPNCGQINVKMGNNNHIFCWACQNHYCYLCRKMVRRSSQHYGPKGCKQHTVG